MVKITSEREEAKCSEALSPGHLLQYDSSGYVKKQATAGEQCAVMVAVENSLEGDGVTDAYASGDRVQYVHLKSGEQFLARIKNGEDIAKGDRLVSGASGLFMEEDTDSSSQLSNQSVLAIALEACDMSSSSGGDDDGFCWAVVL
jgi:hypothetical protein